MQLAKRIFAVISSFSLVFVATFLLVPSANAATITSISNVTNRVNYIDKSQTVGRCIIGTDGGTCTIQKGATIQRTIGVDLGITRSEVAAKLSISASKTLSSSVSCSSPRLKKGQAWLASPIGTRYSYLIKRTLWQGQGLPSVPDGQVTKTAFNPYSSQLYCRAA